MPYQATKASIMALSLYLADEVRGDGVAVDAIHAVGTPARLVVDATARAWKEQGQLYAYRPVIPEHVVPIVLFLAAQNGQGVTGMLYPVPDSDHDHGYGNYAAWRTTRLPPDLEEQFSQAEAAAPTGRPPMGLNTPAMRRP